MFTRIGIELSPAACRIVEVESGPAWRRDTRVRSFAVLPPSGPQTLAALASFRRRRTAVVVWGAASGHRQVVVRPGSYEAMRGEAIAALTAAGVATRGMLVDIAPAAPPRDATRRSVVVALASASAVRSAMQPLVDAGIRARTVMTPAIALSALMRSRRDRSDPGAIEAFVALDETATSIALIRNGSLIVTRGLPWGYIDARQPRRREDIASRLADELAEFFLAAGGSTASVRQVSICGGLPELRSMTVPLMERLDLEVEPLDSLFGIDATQLPRGVSGFQDRIAELRVAWAAAADWPAPLNLLRARHRHRSRIALSRAAVVAGMAAGWGIGWRVAGSPWWQSTAPTPMARTAMPAGRPATATPRYASLPLSTSAPALAPASAPTTVTAPPPRRRAPSPPPPVEPPPRVRELLASPPPVVRAEPVVSLPRPALLTSASAPMRAARAAESAPRAVAALRPAAASVGETPKAFDAVLGTILYSSERRLAIIDGHIVGLGDEVRGARVVEIGPASVLLRDGEGRLRRLTLGAPVR